MCKLNRSNQCGNLSPFSVSRLLTFGVLFLNSMIILAVIAIVLLLVTFVYSILVFRNFGRGLKEACKCHSVLLECSWLIFN